MNITKEFIKSVSTNDSALKNGADLYGKKKFQKLWVSADKTLIFGECAGSGKNPYSCSVDFVDEAAPVFRCSCPSRQIPCKHVLGLMVAYSEGAAFETAEVPEDIANKRENKEKRAAKQKEKAEKQEASENSAPKEKTAAWKKSAVKKIDAQLTGLIEAEKLLAGIAAVGLSTLDTAKIRDYEAVVKRFDSFFIPGIASEAKEFLALAKESLREKNQENAFSAMVEKLCRLNALILKGREYLTAKKDAPDKLDEESEIEELLGYAWKLDELGERGLFEENSRVIQLCFHVIKEPGQLVEEGFYISLSSGKILKTRSYRPLKAAKYIREGDSVFGALNLNKLYIYPSRSLNPRARWEENPSAHSDNPVSPEDLSLAKSFAMPDFSAVVKLVKQQLKNPLLFTHPAVLVSFNKILRPKDANITNESFALVDGAGASISLRKSAYSEESFMFLLNNLTEAERTNNAMLLLFDNDIESGELFAQPLALITDERIIRLVY